MWYPKPSRPESPDISKRTLFELAEFTCRNPDGSVAWSEASEFRRLTNRVANQAEHYRNRTIYRGEAMFGTAFFGRLYNDTPTDTDNLSDLTGEPSSNGYAPTPWSRNTTDFAAPSTVSGQSECVGVRKSFSASGAGWGPVTAFVFATTSDNSGILYGWFMLGQARTVQPGQTLDVAPVGVDRGVTS